ncbi:hypothetical protein AK830_g2627 [Neonectria ditissima]|uniref:NmrA-like domain-containing protein n=1 Tax=Neonectria ditissima TaxID=78410 RepID=A0A0P7BEM2_9HYPO|nr:hypothetical protein AK830_g2627 [Neonectria ditissima]
MSSSKLIVVLGATGNQGGSVVSSFLDDPGWQVRAVTRNTSSPKAQALAKRGAEVIQADISDPSTLPAAFKGAEAIFAVSDFWGLYGDPANKDKAKPGQPLNVWARDQETQQLKNVIDAAAKVPTLERFILSSLSNATKWSKGKYTHVYHFDSKANAVDYGKSQHPDLWAKTSIYQAGFFLNNFVTDPFGQPVKNADGVVQFIQPVNPGIELPLLAAEEDSGPLVKALVQEEPGKNLIGYREWFTLRQVTAAFTEATGLKAEVVTVPADQAFQHYPDELKLELVDTFAYVNEFGYDGGDDSTIIHPRDLKSPPTLATVQDYLKKQDWSKVFSA